MDILPAIDLRAGKCVRLIQGDYHRQIDYDDDPVAVAKRFVKDGAQWLHSVDLDGAKEGELKNLDPIRRIAQETSLKIEVGGGIRTRETVNALLEVGVERVVIGTQAIEDWAWFEDLVREPAHANRIVLGLDAREGLLATHGWIKQTSRTAIDVAEAVADWPLAAIVYTDIARDGMLLGPNIEALRTLVDVAEVPVIAAGGVTDINDVKQLATMRLGGIIIGRAIYEGTLTLPDALAAVASA